MHGRYDDRTAKITLDVADPSSVRVISACCDYRQRSPSATQVLAEAVCKNTVNRFQQVERVGASASGERVMITTRAEDPNVGDWRITATLIAETDHDRAGAARTFGPPASEHD